MPRVLAATPSPSQASLGDQAAASGLQQCDRVLGWEADAYANPCQVACVVIPLRSSRRGKAQAGEVGLKGCGHLRVLHAFNDGSNEGVLERQSNNLAVPGKLAVMRGQLALPQYVCRGERPKPDFFLFARCAKLSRLMILI